MHYFITKLVSILSYLVIVFLLYGFWHFHHIGEIRTHTIRTQTFSMIAPSIGRSILNRQQWDPRDIMQRLNEQLRTVWNQSEYPVDSIVPDQSLLLITRYSKLEKRRIELELSSIRENGSLILQVNIPSTYDLSNQFFTNAIIPCQNSAYTCFLIDRATAHLWANQP